MIKSKAVAAAALTLLPVVGLSTTAGALPHLTWGQVAARAAVTPPAVTTYAPIPAKVPNLNHHPVTRAPTLPAPSSSSLVITAPTTTTTTTTTPAPVPGTVTPQGGEEPTNTPSITSTTQGCVVTFATGNQAGETCTWATDVVAATPGATVAPANKPVTYEP